MFDWLVEHKYELENHFTVFDWLRVYSDSIQKYDMDMNLTLLMEKADREGADFTGSEGRSSEEWKELADVAKYLVDYQEAHLSFKPEFLAEAPDFLATQSDLQDSASHASIW